MNRDQKAVAIAEIATHINESDAIFAVDYRGITVAQVAELRAKLRESDATFKVVKNSLTERAADQVGAETLKALLAGPDRADVRARRRRHGRQSCRRLRAAPPSCAVQGRPDGWCAARPRSDPLALSPALARSALRPARRCRRLAHRGSCGRLLGGLAVALGQVHAKKESGEIPAGEPPAAPAAAAAAPAAEESPAAVSSEWAMLP